LAVQASGTVVITGTVACLCGAGLPRNRGLISPQGYDIFVFSIASTPLLGPNRFTIECVLAVLPVVIKGPKRDAQSNVDVKNAWSYDSFLTYAFMTWWFMLIHMKRRTF
jgi:hypothetical protein